MSAPHARDASLLARYAEGLFWMARYLERVENQARLLDVTQTFESPGREAEAWSALVAINADGSEYAARGLPMESGAVKRFYLLDASNPTSIPASLEMARHNARTLRPLISTEMWMQLNVFHREVMETRPEELEGDQLSRLCRRIKEGVQAHTGVTEGTFFRDQGWHFYQLGRLIERADQITRLLDIKFHLLAGPADGEARRVAELAQWNGVLRAAAGFHAFRRVVGCEFGPSDVVAFLLSDTAFPRSAALCVGSVGWHLHQLRGYGLRGTAAPLERVEELRAALGGPVRELGAGSLHDFLDSVQRDLTQLAALIGTAFFRDWRPLAPPPPSQSQGPDGQTQTLGGMTQSQGFG